MSAVATSAQSSVTRGPRPQGPRRPRERLASLKHKSASLRQRSASLQPVRASSQPRCPECGSIDLSDLNGAVVCAECGTTINESNIVAEVTFGESAAGAAIVQGGFVGEGQRHARTGQPGRYIHEAREPREVSESNGREEIRKQANWLTLSEHVVDQAVGIYKLALNYNFVQGRLIKVVAAVCLYAACRRDPKNQTILMDFAEGIAVNVFKLGQTWSDLKKSLFLEDLRHVPVIEVENLIMKFAGKLEFGNALMRVAEDAARLLKRMKRDWMVTGRRPAGLVGACIILAARMNNFRRTVREVVYVVKVADMTVAKRLEEFKRTQSSSLSVEEFREHGLRLKRTHDPPALYEREQREERERKRQRLGQPSATISSGGEIQIVSEQVSAATISPPNTRRSTRQNPRLDSDGFVIPDLPASSTQQSSAEGQEAHVEEQEASSSESPKTRKIGRPRKSQQRPIPLTLNTERDLIEESELEIEMEKILNDPESIEVVEDAAVDEGIEARAKTLAETLRNPSTTVPFIVPDDPEIGEHEFEDDPEVANCLLSEEERRVKERIWVTHNEDWLRAKQEKMLKKVAEEASGAAKRQKRRRTNKGRMGDGSLLAGGSPVTSAADAARRMLEKHAVNPSRHINYQIIDQLYSELGGPASSRGTNASSRAESVAASDVSRLSGNEPNSEPSTAPGSGPDDQNKGHDPAKSIVQASGNLRSEGQTIEAISEGPQDEALNEQSEQSEVEDEGSELSGDDYETPEDPDEQMSDEDIESTVEALSFDW